MLHKRIIYSLLFLIAFAACNHGQKKGKDPMQDFKMENYFSQDEIDTLLTDMVTFIGVKPRTANSQSRFEPEFRQYYIQYAAQFKMVYFFINKEGEHFFYLIRPARSSEDNARGVGGKFRQEGVKIVEFEEVFNTPVFAEERLIEIGATLFSEMIETGNIDQYLGNMLFVEWPDDRLKYHKGLHEWRYDVEPEK